MPDNKKKKEGKTSGRQAPASMNKEQNNSKAKPASGSAKNSK